MVGYGRVAREMIEVASDALAAGKIHRCRQGVLTALRRANENGDNALRADAYLLLSHAEFVDSRVSKSYEFSSVALKYAEALHDPYRAAGSLEMKSCSASSLGWGDLALASANEALHLRGQFQSVRDLAIGYQYLAVVTAWHGDFASAEGMFISSAEAAQESMLPAARFHPLVNQCFLQVIAMRSNQGSGLRESGVDVLRNRFERCRRMFLAGQAEVLNPGKQNLVSLLLVSLGCQVHLLIGDTDTALDYLETCHARAARLPNGHWARALLWWADFEYAQACGHLVRARSSRMAMEKSAQTGEHRPLQLFAQQRSAALEPSH